jgi:photosystem II stability/assembly factor-like uncharacterized protein
MKRLFLLALWFTIFHVQAQWYIHDSIPTGNSLDKIIFSDSTHGWIIGSAGTILYSDNRGNSWELQNSHTSIDLSGISFINSLHGWAVGGNSVPPGIILHTDNGGMNWEIQDSADYSLNDVFFLDSLHGWIVGNYNALLFTDDGGDIWSYQNLPQIMMPYDVIFLDSVTGFIGGTHHDSGFWLKILKTTDGGNTWQVIRNTGTDNFFCDLEIIDPLHLWLAGDFGAEEIGGGYNTGFFIDASMNGGYNWHETYSSYENWFWGAKSVCFTDLNSGWAVGSDGLVMSTQDGGENWQIQFLSPYTSLSDVTFTDSLHGWAVGKNGTVFYTNNAGALEITDHPVQTTEPGILMIPNPIHDITAIHFNLQAPGYVRVSILNLSGQIIQELLNGQLPKGEQEIRWNPGEVPDGVYFVRIISVKDILTGKIFLVRH